MNHSRQSFPHDAKPPGLQNHGQGCTLSRGRSLIEQAGDGGDPVKNKFINRTFPWIFHQVVSDAHGAMSWLMPDASLGVQEAVDQLCNMKVPDESDEEVHLIGPSLLATLSKVFLGGHVYAVVYFSQNAQPASP